MRHAAHVLSLRVACCVVVGGLAVVACRDDLSAPGRCPAFCPTDPIGLVDTVLPTLIERDSSFGRPVGYVNPFETPVLIAADLPSSDSRPIFRFPGILLREVIKSSDTTTGPVLGPDSVFVTVNLVRRDTATHNLMVRLYRLQKTIDSTTTFADVADSFNVVPVRSINVDSLLAKAEHFDSATGDSARVDSTFAPLLRVNLRLKFDSLQIPWDPADSGMTALGVRITADAPTSATFSASESGAGPGIIWFSRFDSAGTIVDRRQSRGAFSFDGSVFDPPAPAIDSNLAVGGLPAARTLLRFVLPRAIRDSSQIVRATLILVPAVAPVGAPSDSFQVFAQQVATDFGAKSPLSTTTTFSPDSTWIRIGRTDTVTVEVTNFLRTWQADSTIPKALVLRQLVQVPNAAHQEGATLSEIRFYSSRSPAYRPAIHLTYVPRYRFGAP